MSAAAMTTTMQATPVIQVTITGGPRLHSFPSFSVRAVCGFDPSTHGATCLRGPYLRVNGSRVPPMNTPTPYVVPEKAAALYVCGVSSGGPGCHFHAPLVHAPGEHVELPLSSAPCQADVERVSRLLAEQDWIFARTMPSNPHWYTVRRKWARDEDFAWVVEFIRRHGYKQRYGAGWYTVLDVNDHFYWTMGAPLPITILINRKPLAGPVSSEPVDQTFLADDARLLPIPPLPEGFAGLPRAFTSCRMFRWGVATFGWPATDLRPRLRKKGR
jgi:hypothetical protein